MRKYLPIIAILSTIKLCIHLIGNRNYGFHRDELLHLSVSEHLAFGYMEFPPLIAWIGKLSYLTFGYSLSGMRIFATIAGIAILVLCCLMAKEFGARKYGILLAGVAVLAFLPYYRNHMLFQPVAFDQLFWTLGFYWIAKYINTQNNKFLIYLGITSGLGLLNKYTLLIWCLGLVAGLSFFEKGKLLKNKWFYISGVIALLMFFPNLIWQYQHHFPVLLHLQKLKESQLDEMGPYDFVIDQVSFPFTLSLSILGLFSLLFQEHFRKYKSLGVAAVVIFAVMWLTQSKGYYFFAIYPLLFAAGAVKTEQLFERRPFWNYGVVFLLLFPVFFYLPKAIPVLPIENHVRYLNIKPDNSGHYELTDDYADMFGWEEQVKLVDSTYKALSPADQSQCVIFASNYGEAGALTILGKRYGLQQPVCANGSFWLWGAGNKSGNVVLAIGHKKELLDRAFAQVKLVKIIRHRYAVEEENNIGLYICRQPKINLKEIWPTLESHVFD